jgi:hypothetical protein
LQSGLNLVGPGFQLLGLRERELPAGLRPNLTQEGRKLVARRRGILRVQLIEGVLKQPNALLEIQAGNQLNQLADPLGRRLLANFYNEGIKATTKVWL